MDHFYDPGSGSLDTENGICRHPIRIQDSMADRIRGTEGRIGSDLVDISNNLETIAEPSYKKSR